MINIEGNTYYIKGGTNTGIYAYKDEAVIIDPGLSGSRPKRLIKKILAKDLKPSYIINTHEHDDHYGGCGYIKAEFPDVVNCSSEYASLYIENPILFPTYVLGGKSNKEMLSTSKLRKSDITNVDTILYEGYFSLEDGKMVSDNLLCSEFDEKGFKDRKDILKIIPLSGHTEGSIGILTSDGVLFSGDLLIGGEMLEKFDFMFIFDVEKQLESIEKIKDIDFKYLVAGHSKEILSKEEAIELADKNTAAIKKYINQVIDMLDKPMGSDEILKNIIVNNDLVCKYKEYCFFKSSLVSLITYLMDNDIICYTIKNGELLYNIKNI